MSLFFSIHFFQCSPHKILLSIIGSYFTRRNTQKTAFSVVYSIDYFHYWWIKKIVNDICTVECIWSFLYCLIGLSYHKETIKGYSNKYSAKTCEKIQSAHTATVYILYFSEQIRKVSCHHSICRSKIQHPVLRILWMRIDFAKPAHAHS